ncbi:MAG: hypothetical protein JXA21_24400 [Anaerolineae bacterium]|nr:hypothetical protein [Anaerolineae bacterium]
MKSNPPFWYQWLWLVPAVVGGALTFMMLFVLPPDRVVHGLDDFIFKIMPLVCAVLAVAMFPQKPPFLSLFLLLGVVFYMGYLDSGFFLRIEAWIRAVLDDNAKAGFSAFYQFNLLVNSFTILFALFAYRLGGGRTASVLKLGLSSVLIMLSGLNDLTMWIMYPWPNGERPFVFDWASHVEVFIGREPNLYHMLGFFAAHLILIGVILALPLQRWLDQLKARWLLGKRADAASA